MVSDISEGMARDGIKGTTSRGIVSSTGDDGSDAYIETGDSGSGTLIGYGEGGSGTEAGTDTGLPTDLVEEESVDGVEYARRRGTFANGIDSLDAELRVGDDAGAEVRVLSAGSRNGFSPSLSSARGRGMPSSAGTLSDGSYGESGE